MGSQVAQHVIEKVCAAYRIQRSNLANGNYGPRSGSTRRERIESAPIAFGPGSTRPFDQRNLSLALDARTLSLWTFQGRPKAEKPTREPCAILN